LIVVEPGFPEIEEKTMKTILMAALAASLVAPVTVSAPAFGKDRTYQGGRHDYRYRCRTSHHTVGTVAGGAGGALVGSAIGGPIATIAGGVGGALLGRHIDKREHQKRQRERGC
jgi:uncharacterized protein YcfJ